MAFSQTPALTTVKDTVYATDGTLASGTVVITWPSFVTADGKAVFGSSKTLTLTSGALGVSLVPNAGGTPSGTSYDVQYSKSGGVFAKETWVVPASSPLANPAIPVSVTQSGTPGSTTYYYWCSATNANGETLLSSSPRSTTTSNATLSGVNYNIITCATVSGATGYRVYRTTTSTAPSSTGNYLVGSDAGTTINDQSNTLTATAIPSVNDTDARALSQVRVTVSPSPSVVFAASQVTGTAVVENPSSTQTVTAPATSGVPLQVKGKNGNGSSVLEVYDNAATPARQAYFDSMGGLFLGKAPTISTMTAGSVLFAAAAGLLSQDTSNLFWDKSGKKLGVKTSGPLATLDVRGSIFTTDFTHWGYTAAPGTASQLGWQFFTTLDSSSNLLCDGADKMWQLFVRADSFTGEGSDLAYSFCNAGSWSEWLRFNVSANQITIAKPIASPTLTTPIIGSFTNANHNHQNSAGGGPLDAVAIATGNLALARLPAGSANQILGTNSGGTAQEHKTLATGTGGTDFAIAHAPNTITFNLPDAAATARGAVSTAIQTFAGVKTFQDGIVIGAGASIAKHLSSTAALDFASVAANACADLAITVTGAADGDSVAIGVPSALASTAGLVFTGFVSAASTVTVRACNAATSASANPAAATVRADVWQH